MSDALYPDDPTEYMVALGALMIVGTTVAAPSVFIEKGLDWATADFPAIIINCPDTALNRVTITAQYQATFSIKVAYLDRWDSASRTLAQAVADAKTVLYRMARNIRSQPDLGMTFLMNGESRGEIVQADMQQHIRVDQATRDLGIGFPLVTGLLEVEVVGPFFQPD